MLVLTSTHTQPVAAGTVVVFYASHVENSDGAANQKPTGAYRWTVFGPRAGEHVVMQADDRNAFNWDTTRLQPGAYDIRCEFFKDDLLKRVEPSVTDEALGLDITTAPGSPFDEVSLGRGGTVRSPGSSAGVYGADGQPTEDMVDSATQTIFVQAAPAGAAGSDGVMPVSLQRTALVSTPDQILWVLIRNRTNAVAFRQYKDFIDDILCSQPGSNGKLSKGNLKVRDLANKLPYRGADAYQLLKMATNAFLMHETGVIDENALFDSSPAGALNIDSALAQMAADGVEESETRRLGLRSTVTLPELRRMREQYYADLQGEQDVLLPYLGIIRDRLRDIPLKPPTDVPANCYGILRTHLTGPPAMELIWSYWHEEGMLAQSLNAILARFQNRRLQSGRDPLARFDLDPLRPLSNLFWGWAQDEIHRLTVRRRAFEYEHEYGLQLIGKAVPAAGRTVDRRSKFLEAFHNLLYLSHVFFKEDDDTTVIADGFPVLNALRETHLILAEGAHNQFGDLPSVARAEMLVMQWLLARPEMREFIGGRVMVPYEEDWMDRVDTMKTIEGWTDVTITHFRDMGVFGEQIVLSVRYGNWSTANDPQQAANWARYWRPEIQRYAHAYRAATGVDLTERVDSTMPSELLRRRLSQQQRRA